MTSQKIMEMVVGLFGGLGVFLYGMRVMSRGLESIGGSRLRIWLQKLTGNPIASVLTGLLVTCLIQSSSATTVMLVSLVHAGLLNLAQGIGIIMGANIGTTITGWLVSILGFKVKIDQFALPAIGFGVIFLFFNKGKKKIIFGEVLVGFGLLFLGLMFMKDSVKFLNKAPEIKALLGSFSASNGMVSLLLAVLVGALVTVVIQSSSATMALTMTLAQQGIINFPTAAALILGENIGTTITANLAAIGTEHTAKQTARAHFFFNIFGVVWAIACFPWLIKGVDWLIPGTFTESNNIPLHMSAFHTSFNLINTLLFLPFVEPFARFVEKVFPHPLEKSKRHQVKYIETQLVSTPGFALSTANIELKNMSQKVMQIIHDVHTLFKNPEENFEEYEPKIQEMEEEIDQLEKEISNYLIEVSKEMLTDEISDETNRMINIAHRLEKVGDHGEGLLMLIRRCLEEKTSLPGDSIRDISSLFDKVEIQMKLVFSQISENKPKILTQAGEAEEKIDQQRNELRSSHTLGMTERTIDVPVGLAVLEIIDHLERIGDHSYKIARMLSNVSSSKSSSK